MIEAERGRERSRQEPPHSVMTYVYLGRISDAR